MAWVKLDDQAPRNLKMLRAGPAACWFWVCGIAHSQSQLTDGFISTEALPMIGVVGIARAKRLAETLVEAGLFERVEGGYQVHDYLDHNPSRHAVLTKRAEDAARKHHSESVRNPSGIQADSRGPRAGGRRMGWVDRSLSGKIVADELGERAGRLVERFGVLYTKHRRGARYVVKPSLDWDRACELCSTWDDARLEKLMTVFLTTDDDWISRTDRGFGVFCSKASWCDDRLTAAESGAA